MTEDQLKNLATATSLDYNLLKLIYDRFHPNTEADLIKIANTINADGSTNNIDQIQLINQYATQFHRLTLKHVRNMLNSSLTIYINRLV